MLVKSVTYRKAPSISPPESRWAVTGPVKGIALRLHVTAHPQADEFAAVWGQRDVNGHVAAIALDRGGDGVADESAVFV